MLQLTESLIDVYGVHVHWSEKILGREVRALVPHLPKALFKVNISLGEINDLEMSELNFFFFLVSFHQNLF